LRDSDHFETPIALNNAGTLAASPYCQISNRPGKALRGLTNCFVEPSGRNHFTDCQVPNAGLGRADPRRDTGDRMARYSLPLSSISQRIWSTDGRSHTFCPEIGAGTGPAHSRGPRDVRARLPAGRSGRRAARPQEMRPQEMSGGGCVGHHHHWVTTSFRAIRVQSAVADQDRQI
jgi:hypothetical protein